MHKRRETGASCAFLEQNSNKPDIMQTQDNADMRQLQGCILTPTGWVQGEVRFTSHVCEVRGKAVDGPSDIDTIIRTAGPTFGLEVIA